MTPKHKVAVVSPRTVTRIALAGYLKDAGFDVHECEELDLPTAFDSLVVLEDDNERLVDAIRGWIKLTRHQRLVVVTSKPSVFRELVALHGDRLQVLPAPAFGWDLVDVLRAKRPTRPRGA